MEGTEKVKLISPNRTHRNPIGEIVKGINNIEINVWCQRDDKRGLEREYGFTETTDFNTIFILRETNALKDINETWYLIDSYEQRYDIQAVARRRRYNGRYKIILLQCKRRI